MELETYYAKKARYYDLINTEIFKETKNELKFFKWIFKKFGKKVKRVLDIGCGTGRFSIPLSEMDHKVIGIDLSKTMLDIAREKIKKGNRNVKFKKANMKTFKDKKKFDFVVCGDSSLTYMLTKKDVVKTSRNIYRNLNKNGIFAFDVWNYIDYKYKPFEKWTIKKKGIKITDSRKQDIDSKGHMIWTDTIHVVEGKKSFIFKISSKIKLWRYKEWVEMFKDAGFKIIECYSNPKHRKQFRGVPERFYFIAVK